MKKPPNPLRTTLAATILLLGACTEQSLEEVDTDEVDTDEVDTDEHALEPGEEPEFVEFLPTPQEDPRRTWVRQADEAEDALVLELLDVVARERDYLLEARVREGNALAPGEVREFSLHKGVSCSFPIDLLSGGDTIHVRLAPAALDQDEDQPLLLATAAAGGALPPVLEARRVGEAFHIVYPWGTEPFPIRAAQ